MALHSKEHIVLNSEPIRLKRVVYFLISCDEIVYVGKSIDGLSRVYTHFKNGRYTFDSYWYIECLEEKELKSLEMQYIKEFQPKYNIQHKDQPHEHEKPKKICTYTLMETTDEMLREHLKDSPISMSAFVDVAIQEKIAKEKEE